MPLFSRHAVTEKRRRRLIPPTQTTPEWLESRIAPAGIAGSHAAAASPGQVHTDSANYVWNGSVSSDWFDAGNWTPNGVPGATDSAVLNIASTINLSAPVAVAHFTENAGTIQGTGSLSIQSAMDWNGGTLGVATTISDTAALTINNPGNVTLDNVNLNLSGLTVWTGGGNFVMNGAASLSVASEFDIETDAIIGATGAGTKTVAVLSTGMLQKLGGSGTTDFAAGIAFTNSGLLNIASGMLMFDGSFLQNTGSTNLQGGTIGSSGTLTFSSGQLNGSGLIAGNLTNTNAILQPGGTDATGTLAITGDYTQNGGAALAIEIAGPSQADQLYVFGTATLAGTLNVTALGGYQANASDAFDAVTAGVRSGVFGSVNTGSLHLTTQYTPTAARLIGQATSYVWDGGAGNTDWFSPANWSPDGVPGPGDSATLGTAATINLTNPATVGSFTQTNGTFTGSAMLSISSAFTWSGGTQSGTGATQLLDGGVLQISGAAAKTLDGRALNLFGDTTWSGTGNIVFNSGTLHNEPGRSFNIQTDADLVDSDGSGTIATFINDGTLTKSMGATGNAATELNAVVFNNFGTLNAGAGTLTFGGGFTQFAGTTNLAGGNLAQSGTLNFQGGTLSGAGTIAGSVANSGATIEPGGSGMIGVIAITGDYTQTGGSVAIEIGGTMPGTQFDQLSVGGMATLGGELDAGYLNGFAASPGNAFAVLPYASHTGAFDTFHVPPGLAANDFASAFTLNALQQPTVVTTALDTLDPADNVVSLREAILYANAHPGFDFISFAIPGAGVHIISLGGVLPEIADITVIDGYSQPGASANTLATGSNAVLQIQLDGGGTVPGGLEISAPDVTVRGLAITGFAAGSGGLIVHDSGTDAVITGNFIGLDPSGAAGGNTAGILIDGAHQVTVGGTAPGDRNIVSGNLGAGIVISGNTAMDNQVVGNFIGTDPAGATTRANGSMGILIVNGASHNAIGGSTAGAGNVISGNGAQNGMVIDGVGSDSNHVQGNFIGTNAAGTAALPNFFGIVVSGGAQDNIIGGTAAGTGNLISGNTVAGVVIKGTGTADNLVEGNHIGTAASGASALGNGTGVFLSDVSSGNTIGGTAAGAGNFIAFNQTGILVDTKARGEILLGNSVQANAGVQIDLGGDGATPNDGGAPPDADTGANDLQNFPVISDTYLDATGLHFIGSLASTPNTTFRLEFFEQAAAASGGALLPTFLDFKTVTTDAQGQATFNFVSSAAAQIGDQVLATATDLAGAGTSEFAPAVAVAPPLPTISIHDAIVLEGSTGTTPLTFTLTLDHADPTQTVTAHFATSDSTALAGSDYVGQSGIVTFAPGTTQATITIDVNGDTLAEFRERFHLTLSDPTHGTIGNDTATGIIQDDDHHFIAAGSGHGGALSIYQTTASSAMRVAVLKPFGTAFLGGVRVAVGDINGDGVDDFVAGAGTGTNGRVRVYDGTTMQPFADPQYAGLSLLKAFPGYNGGVFVAVGDVNADGLGDIIVSKGSGRTNTVKVFSGVDGSLFSTFQAFSNNVVGVRIAAGDVNGDGYADVIAGSGTGSAVKVFDVHGNPTLPATLQSFDHVFATSYHAGVFVAAGDLADGTHLSGFDGTDDLIVSAGTGRANVQLIPEDSTTTAQTILGYAAPFHGVRVGTADVNGDGIADIIAAQGSGGSSRMTVLSGLNFNSLFAFTMQPKSGNGVFVG